MSILFIIRGGDIQSRRGGDKKTPRLFNQRAVKPLKYLSKCQRERNKERES